jgi:hypothetical protein
MGGFANNAPIVTDGLVFYVDAGNGNSYPGSGTTWTDLVGGNDGALTNGPTYDSGNGGSIVFDGVDDVVLVTGDITNLINDYSVDIWWDCNDGEPRLYYSRSSGGVTISSRGTDGFKLTKFGVVDIYTGSCPTDTNIHNVVVTYSSTDGVKVYLDGSLNGSDSNTSDQNSYSTIKIGNGQDGSHDGNIYTTKIYNKVLSASEVLQNYNALKNRFV